VDTIVAGYDGTDQSERALARAADLARALKAKLVVVSVGREQADLLPPPVDPGLVPSGLAPLPTGTTVPGPEPPAPDEPAEEERLLERARGFLEPRRIEAEYLPETGDPAKRLLEVAGDRDADLIVVGSSEHGFLDRLLGQAVDEQVARRAERDVLLVR
jgi:nucleotide-binding universal stress UspA family protein